MIPKSKQQVLIVAGAKRLPKIPNNLAVKTVSQKVKKRQTTSV
jgi:hypothetical protein